VRSADICRVIASCTNGGGLISRISTFVTFTPQRSVTSSELHPRRLLISSRFASTSSSEMSPTTARRVVAAMLVAAPAKFETPMTDVGRVEHLVVHDEVDRDRGVVLRDRVLARDLQIELTEVDDHALGR
jgi:hypothetical protein